MTAIQIVIESAYMSHELLERIGILKHRVTIEELDAGEARLRSLTVDYMTGKIELPEYRAETEKLPGLDLRQLAQELHYKG